MKRFLTSLLSVTLTIPLVVLSMSVVSAKTAVLSASTSASNSETTTTSDQKDMLDRLAKYKIGLKLKLTTLQQTRIKNRCQQAQTGGIKSLSGRIKGVETSRNQVYTNLTNRLDKLVVKLKAKGIDTSKIESEIAVLKTKVDTFKADLATYKQDVGDLKDMNCGSDPTAFKAALETGRTQRQKLFQDVTDIRNYLKNTIKPTLKDIRSQIESQNKADTNKSSNNTTGGQ